MSEAVECAHNLDRVVRSLSAAVKALRLYPPTSPIPAQSLDAAAEALDEVFATGETRIVLTVERDCFSSEGVPVCPLAPGVHEILESLHGHGVSAIEISAGCTADEVLALLTSLLVPAEDLRGCGGLLEMLEASGVTHVALVGVHLTVVDAPIEFIEDTDEFLRELSRDPDKLAAWFSGAALGDPRAFEEGLMELVRVSGPSGFSDLLSALAHAFGTQGQEAKDALLGLSLDTGPTRDLTGAMFALLPSNDIAASVLGGLLGRNVLSLSSALTRLPLEKVTAEVRAEVQAMLPSSGHTEEEAEFLGHMISVRELDTPEPALVESDQSYEQVAESARVESVRIEGACAEVSSSKRLLNRASVSTMLALLDQQRDFELYCRGMDNLAAMVAPLMRQGDVDLASTVLRELTRRESLELGPWPELSGRVHEAIAEATGPETMTALFDAMESDPELVESAREFVRLAGADAVTLLVGAAIERKEQGLSAAESLLGERLDEALARQLPTVAWHLLGPAVRRLGRSGGSGGVHAVQRVMRRPDEQSRREVVNALAEVDSPLALNMLSHGLYDPSVDVVLAAAKGLGKSRTAGAAEALAARLERTDLDTEDFDVVVALIGSLAQQPGPVADQSLEKLQSRRGLVKRARHGEIQDLIRRAQAYRTQGVDSR